MIFVAPQRVLRGIFIKKARLWPAANWTRRVDDLKISVIGCGRWGTFLAWYLNGVGHEVTLYGRPGSANMRRLMDTRQNAFLTLPEGVRLTQDLREAAASGVIAVSVASQSLRSLMQKLRFAENKLYVLCMKGLEIGTGKRLSVVAGEEFGPGCRAAVWLGPGHVQEFVRGVPNCMVIDTADAADKDMLVEAFSSDLVRFYYGKDLVGNEIGAAAKNVVGIAAGFLDGFGLTSLKGALMSRGTREYARLIRAMGGNELSAYGLCHLGDYEATVFSPHSHNRKFGECYATGVEYCELAEGYYTVQALMQLAEETGTELPISNAIHRVLYENEEPKKALNSLFSRSLKEEFL